MTLKEALKLSSEDIEKLKDDLKIKIKNSNVGAYIEQLENKDIYSYGNGIPIAIKNNINVKNWELTCSSNILKGYISPFNATVIEKLESSGLSPFGLTNMDEFAMGSSTESSAHGKTLNPIDNSRIPGGSSGGSAAAVAAGIAIAALGTDTGGSIRQPAAYCGVVGMKPTYGRVSRYGIAAYSSSLDQCGPITQNVEDAAILYDIIAGHEPKDSTSANMAHQSVADNLNADRKMTIAVIENYLNEASPEVRESMMDGIRALEKAGHTIIYRNFINSKYDIATYYVIATAEASANLSRYDGVRYGNRGSNENLKEMFIQSRSLGFGEEVKRRILLGTFVLSSGYYDAYYIKAQRARHFIKAQYEAIFKEADLIFMPVTPTSAFEFGSKADPLEMYLSDIYTISLNLAGLPGISVPLGMDSKGLPVGGQLIGQAYGEQALLDGALSLERELGL